MHERAFRLWNSSSTSCRHRNHRQSRQHRSRRTILKGERWGGGWRFRVQQQKLRKPPSGIPDSTSFALRIKNWLSTVAWLATSSARKPPFLDALKTSNSISVSTSRLCLYPLLYSHALSLVCSPKDKGNVERESVTDDLRWFIHRSGTSSTWYHRIVFNFYSPA